MIEAVYTAPIVKQLIDIDALSNPLLQGRLEVPSAPQSNGITAILEMANESFYESFPKLKKERPSEIDLEEIFLDRYGEINIAHLDTFQGILRNLVSEQIVKNQILRLPSDENGTRAFNLSARIFPNGELSPIPFQAEFLDISSLISKLEIDPTTNVANRFSLENIIKELEKGENPYGLIFIDLAEFKITNDEFGHLTGDNALRKVGELLESSVRVDRGDSVVVRYGGDEFVLVLKGCKPEGVAVVEKRINQKFKNFNRFQEREEKQARTSLPRLNVTLGAVHSTETVNNENLIEIADKRMYEQKQNQRYRLLVNEIPQIFTESSKTKELEKFISEIENNQQIPTKEKINLLVTKCYEQLQVSSFIDIIKLSEVAKRVGYDYRCSKK